MQIIEKGVEGICECCKIRKVSCDILIYGQNKAVIICKDCWSFIKELLNEVGVEWWNLEAKNDD